MSATHANAKLIKAGVAIIHRVSSSSPLFFFARDPFIPSLSIHVRNSRRPRLHNALLTVRVTHRTNSISAFGPPVLAAPDVHVALGVVGAELALVAAEVHVALELDEGVELAPRVTGAKGAEVVAAGLALLVGGVLCAVAEEVRCDAREEDPEGRDLHPHPVGRQIPGLVRTPESGKQQNQTDNGGN